MKKKAKRSLSLILALILALVCLAGCGSNSDSSDDTSEDVYYKIGIAVYDTTDPQVQLFYTYYRDYIAESFPVEFYLSDSLSSTEDEIEYIEEMKEEGVQGIISFYAPDLEEILEACAENDIYYVLGSSTIDDDVYEAVKDNEYFLGVIGPSDEEEYNSGVEMAEYFIDAGAESYLIISGGSGEASNYMHYTRTLGILDTLESELGLEFSESAEDLAQASELTVVDTGSDVTIVISPGYLDYDEGSSNAVSAMEDYDFDAIMAVCGINPIIDNIEEEIEVSSSALSLVGVIDCFSYENYEAFETKDANGNSLLNFVKGKYASMIAPAFVAMYNALSGDMDVIKPDGEAFRIYQTYWTATSADEYAELYGYTQSSYENAYSATDLMEVIKDFNEDASYEAFEELAVSCDVESVMERIEE